MPSVKEKKRTAPSNVPGARAADPKGQELNGAAARAKFQNIWLDRKSRRTSPGELIAEMAMLRLGCAAGDSCICWGCGTGREMMVFHRHGIKTTGIDIAENAIDPAVRNHVEGPHSTLSFMRADICSWAECSRVRADFSFCADVLQYIPAEQIENALGIIAGATAEAVYIQVCHNSDDDHYLTVQPVTWWIDMIEQFMTIEKIIQNPDPRGLQVHRTGFIVNPYDEDENAPEVEAHDY